jgi:hypothetical protein
MRRKELTPQEFDRYSDPAYWIEYERRVAELEAKGLTRSDAQGVIDAEDV